MELTFEVISKVHHMGLNSQFSFDFVIAIIVMKLMTNQLLSFHLCIITIAKANINLNFKDIIENFLDKVLNHYSYSCCFNKVIMPNPSKLDICSILIVYVASFNHIENITVIVERIIIAVNIDY